MFNALTQSMAYAIDCVLLEDDLKRKVETCHNKNCTNKQMLIRQYLICLIQYIVIVVLTAPFESMLRHIMRCIL
jgi:hypothetical protein